MTEDFFLPPPRALGHRGDSFNYPENTAPAFQAAVETGIDVIETDVHLTADGQVVIWHDPSLERLSGDPRPIRSLTAKELSEVDAGARFSSDGNRTFPFRGKGIRPLLLEEGLKQFPETRFNIDLKDDLPELAAAAARVLRETGAEKRVCIASFHHRVLCEFRKHLPETATSLSRREMAEAVLLYRFGAVPRAVRNGSARAVQIPEKAGFLTLVTPSFIRWCRKHRLAIQVWTVNDPADMQRLYEAGVDGIFSDRPEMVSAAAAAFFGGSPG